MNSLMLEDIKNDFAEVIVNLRPGEVVQIVSGNKVIAHLTGAYKTLSYKTLGTMRQPGSAIGTLKIIVDDDKHLQDFIDYMP